MANQRNITLREGEASSKNIRLHALPIADVITVPIYLYPNHATPSNIILRDPRSLVASGASYVGSAERGIFLVTGNGVVYGLSNVVGAGAFSLTGQSALSKLSSLASSGAFLLTGQDTHSGLTSPASSGSFSLSGQNVVLRLTSRGEVGTFILNGQSTGAGLSSQAGAGSFALTGNSTNQHLSHVPNAGAFILGGQAIDGVYTPAGGGSPEAYQIIIRRRRRWR